MNSRSRLDGKGHTGNVDIQDGPPLVRCDPGEGQRSGLDHHLVFCHVHWRYSCVVQELTVGNKNHGSLRFRVVRCEVCFCVDVFAHTLAITLPLVLWRVLWRFRFFGGSGSFWRHVLWVSGLLGDQLRSVSTSCSGFAAVWGRTLEMVRGAI